MQIAFKKVIKEGLDFSLEKDGLNFFGKVYAKPNGLVQCVGNIKGSVEHVCDRCGDDVDLDLDESIDIFISNGIYKNSETDQIDVVEFYEDFIDFGDILDSEIEAFKSDYHYCQNCINIKE